MATIRSNRLLILFVSASLAIAFAAAIHGVAQSRVHISGTYRNVDYGYSVVVPMGLEGDRLGAPAPNHGFGIDLKSGRNDSIFVDASYDAILLGTLDAVSKDEVRDTVERYNLTLLSRTITTVDGLPASDLIFTNARATGEINYVHVVLSYRSVL